MLLTKEVFEAIAAELSEPASTHASTHEPMPKPTHAPTHAPTHSPIDVVMRGYELYRTKAVKPRRVVAQKMIYGDVMDGRTRHTVGMKRSVDGLAGSLCSCGRKPYCSHLVAFFYQVAEESGYKIESPAASLSSRLSGRPSAAESTRVQHASPQPPFPDSTNGPRVTTSLTPAPTPLSPAELWLEQMEREVEHHAGRNREVAERDYVKFQGAVADSMRKFLPSELYPHAKMLSACQFLRKAEERVLENNYYYWGGLSNFGLVYERCLSSIFEAVKAVDRVQLESPEVMDFIRHVITALRKSVFEDTRMHARADWLELYRYIWWHAIPMPLFAEEERNYLQDRWDSLEGAVNINPQTVVRNHIIAASTHLEVLRGDDDAAMDWLQRLDQQQWAELLKPYFEVFAAVDRERMIAWLHRLKPYAAPDRIGGRYYAFVGWYCHQWLLLLEASGADAETDSGTPPETDSGTVAETNPGTVAETDSGTTLKTQTQLFDKAADVFVSLLPYSYDSYQNLLMAMDDLERWADLQLMMGFDATELKSSHLKHVEKHRPDLLLPIYHTTIEQYVARRNRDSYKIAVRYLAKLPKLYKKLKRVAEWTEFLGRFTARYSRLRALQEEIQRRKGIS